MNNDIKLFGDQVIQDYDKFLLQSKEYKNYIPRLCLETDGYTIEPLSQDMIYLYQDITYFKHFIKIVKELEIKEFIDIGSRLLSMYFYAQFAKCRYVECRKISGSLIVNDLNLEFIRCEAQNLPFRDNSEYLITSLHAIEHFGLGKYGDTIDYAGDVKALKECYRVLMSNGILLLSVPCSSDEHTRIQFNNQRIYTKNSISEILTDIGFKICDTAYICFDVIEYPNNVISYLTKKKSLIDEANINQYNACLLFCKK